MIRQSGHRFADADHAAEHSMIRQSGHRFADADHAAEHGMIRQSWDRFADVRSCGWTRHDPARWMPVCRIMGLKKAFGR
jgi:hypothetical protein